MWRGEQWTFKCLKLSWWTLIAIHEVTGILGVPLEFSAVMPIWLYLSTALSGHVQIGQTLCMCTGWGGAELAASHLHMCSPIPTVHMYKHPKRTPEWDFVRYVTEQTCVSLIIWFWEKCSLIFNHIIIIILPPSTKLLFPSQLFRLVSGEAKRLPWDPQ